MDVVAAALEHVEHGAVQMAVLLSVGARRVDLDMGLDRLGDCGGLRADHVLAVKLRAALPGHVARRIDPRLLEQRLVEVAVGAFERRTNTRFFDQRSQILVLRPGYGRADGCARARGCGRKGRSLQAPVRGRPVCGETRQFAGRGGSITAPLAAGRAPKSGRQATQPRLPDRPSAPYLIEMIDGAIHGDRVFPAVAVC